MSSESLPPLISGLSTIAAGYDAVICDVWGVLHNGREAFRPAIDAMRRFRAARGPVVLLSNAPRLDDGVRALFDRLAMPHDFYDAIVTSGSEAREDLLRRTQGGRALKLFYLGPERDHALFEGLNIRLVKAEDAELVLCTGFYDDETEAPDDYRPLLESFRASGLLFLCANPDIVVQRGDRLIFCAGAIARLYELIGGEVVYYGKPYAPVFHAAIREARKHGASERPLVIGDGLETDIVGANRLGLDALFITGGIHKRAVNDRAAMVELLAASSANPKGFMPALSW